jgi:hypothetical protein
MFLILLEVVDCLHLVRAFLHGGDIPVDFSLAGGSESDGARPGLQEPKHQSHR